MASIKSLFFVAFALSIGVLTVNSTSLMEILQPKVPISTRSNLEAGARQPGDYLVNTMAISEAHGGGGAQMNIYKRIDLYPGQVITLIRAIDQSGGNTQVSVAEGGPGQHFAVLLFQSPTNTIQYVIEVYAK